MDGNVLFILILVVIAAAISVLLHIMVTKFDVKTPGHVFGFEGFKRVDIPYIIVEVKGKKLNMIVDTGCGVSIITKDTLNEVPHQECNRAVSLEALTSDSLDSGMVTIPVTVGNKEIMEDFAVCEHSDIGNFKAHCGITMHGILGNEFMEKTKCKIDYNKHTVTLA